MKLIIGNDLQSATVPVRWCLDAEEAQLLKNKESEGKECYILLATADIHPYGEEVHYVDSARQVLPFKNGMTFLSFDRPGEKLIKTAVFFADRGQILQFVKKDKSREYSWGLISYYDGEWNGYVLDDVDLAFDSYQTKIEVPKEFFAPQPPAWEKWWVNLWFETSPFDQCQHRKRRFLAYTVQPPLVFLWVIAIGVLRIITAFYFGVLSTYRGVNWSPIIHPFDHETNDIWYHIHEVNGNKISYVLYDKDNEKRSGWFELLIPMNYLVVVLFVLVSHSILKSVPALAPVESSYLMLTAFIVAAGALILILFWKKLSKGLSVFMSFMRTSDYAQRRRVWKAQQLIETKKHKEEIARLAHLKERKELDAAVQQLTCVNSLAKAEVSELPKEMQSIKLRFLDLKSKVCRPFAKG